VRLWSTAKRLQVSGYAVILLFPVNGYVLKALIALAQQSNSIYIFIAGCGLRCHLTLFFIQGSGGKNGNKT
jgi:hypothetical protein